MTDHCGSVTEDGAAVCVPGSCSCSPAVKYSEPIQFANVGWVYGGLTFLSVISLVLGVRWMGQKNEAKRLIETERKTTRITS